MEPIFELRDVSYTYLRRFEALKEVTLTFCAGEQTAILGANGSGKSTLLSILNALTYPTSGEFSAFGNPVKEEVFDTLEDNEFISFSGKGGFSVPEPGYPAFSSTVFDEIAFGPLQLDMPPEEVLKRTEEVITMLGIENLQDPGTSYAERRRKRRKSALHQSSRQTPMSFFLMSLPGVLTHAARSG